MTNLEIICTEAILHGIYSKEEIEDMLAQGTEPEIHTFSGWKIRGKRVRHGEKGIETRLWKKRKNNKEEADKEEDIEESSDFYLAKAYLFTALQVEDDVQKSA